MSFEHVKQIADMVGGKIESVAVLPDGSGAATVSLPLPKDHWIYGYPSVENHGNGWSFEPSPMPLRMERGAITTITIHRLNKDEIRRLTKDEMAELIRSVGKYAIRASTSNGKENDFDPDAMLQNLVVGFLGYWTETGLSSDDFANPKAPTE